MTTFWTDIEILRFIDAAEKREHGTVGSGLDMLKTLAAERGVGLADDDYRRFLSELFVLHNAGLLTWVPMQSPARVRQITPAEPLDYLNNTRDFTLTYAGRNQVQGRVVLTPLPDRAEDDGRMIASLTLEGIAKCIGGRYDSHQAVLFLADSRLAFGHEPPADGEVWEKLLVIFAELSRGTSGERRELRHFLGAWLDDQLHTGPTNDECDRIERDLARQGWFVRDGRLVVGEPVRRGRGTQAPPPAVDRLHPIVWKAAATRWAAKHLHDAVIAASKAVNATLQAKIGRSDVSEVRLIQQTFSSKPPTATEPRLRFLDIADRQTRDSVTAGALQFGVGCFMATRNPIGHRPDDEHEMTEQEALEQLAAWSLFARWIDRAEVVES
ncbi:MAG TPA: TIGR02391 family protein [Solirubrobacteraceae bacterium]|nr:TIGR02391 family protein [Solirubrobacteraceae bacterium]